MNLEAVAAKAGSPDQSGAVAESDVKFVPKTRLLKS
eukprot:CAMPEP_0185591226 /NCGR_PEP_ID=MMETSP0434-20130131/63836_1 /TAXON_ID=626734 ORGANISM="Favella taraikaensis, Strain Fe Narragansett Bay" /NCGR_SAMPLE_ID=MMETSP0434 /ASSEMBLY_ACC=CAM_ASM_000379 /LENGTH=35 /DNA_ID= /DNA_START= /DNA_END= /DNA_ORIENTATION=